MADGDKTTKADRTETEDGEGGSIRFVGLARALIGGALAFCVVLAGTLIVGRVSGFEARSLLESMLPTARFLYSSVITASATILALMLTLLSLSDKSKSSLKHVHYTRVKEIALIDTITLVAAMALLLFLVLPIQESDSVPSGLYEAYYYLSLTGAAILGGLLVTIVLMLYTTVSDMIVIIGFGDEDHPMIDSDDS